MLTCRSPCRTVARCLLENAPGDTRIAAVQELRAHGFVGAFSSWLGKPWHCSTLRPRQLGCDLLTKAVIPTRQAGPVQTACSRRWNEGCHDAAGLHIEYSRPATIGARGCVAPVVAATHPP